MADKDFDKMSDDDFEAMLDNIDELDADIESEEKDFEETDHDDVESEDDESEAETNQDDADQTEDSDEDFEDEEDDDDEENAHNIEDDDESEDDEEDEPSEDEEDDESEESTGDQAEPEAMTTDDKTDYRKAYEEALAQKQQYEDFYKNVTSEYVANGKTMPGFQDPGKIKLALQKAAGFDDKMAAFKPYRKFITPLKENGMLDDPAKFNLMMNAAGGDKEAIKQLISNAEIDPVELDMDNIDYKAKDTTSSQIAMAYEDVMTSASQNGVKDRVQSVINADWDDQSVVELLEDPQNSADLVNHISTGVYDMVQERITQKKMTDPMNVYGSKKAIDQYREAASELDAEYKQYLAQQQVNPEQNQAPQAGNQGEEFQFTEEEIQEEIARIREEKSYSAKVEKKNAAAEKGRKKAASVSKRKPRTKRKETTFDPGKMSDEEFTDYLDSMLT